MPTSPPADVQSPGAADALFSSPPQFRHSGTLGLGRLRGCAGPADAARGPPVLPWDEPALGQIRLKRLEKK